MFTADWIALNEEWRQRSEHMFQRWVKAQDMTKAQLAWEAFCNSEERREEWKYLCLQQHKRVGIAAAAKGE